MILHDYFSGTGGFHLGLEKAGFEFDEVCFSEIDKHAIANYKYNFPNAKYIGEIGSILNSGAGKPNIITFGSPCQDFSLAGLRKGLDGEKSSLIEQAVSAIAHYRPDIFIWENVKGAFSSNTGSDFWAIIQAFANIGGYGLEWQLVNTSWILPQNRERIYLIGHLTACFRNWKRVFPIGEEDSNNTEIKSESQSDIARTIIAGYGKIPTDGQYVQILSKGHGFAKDSITEYCPTIRNSSFQHNTAVVQLNQSTESGGVQPYQHNRIYDSMGLSPALSTDSRTPLVIGSMQANAAVRNDGICTTLTSAMGMGGGHIPMIKDTNIRRLTEKECERLQGFPDDWTKWGNYDGVVKEIPKTQRYKMCGNAVTAKMVELIGKQLKLNYE